MDKNEFLIYNKTSQVVTDLDGAIEVISSVVNRTGQKELVLKLGEILGKVSAYRLTGDSAILESVVVDIANIMQNICGTSGTYNASQKQYDIYEKPTQKSGDLIYFETANHDWLDKRVLLDGFFKFLIEQNVVGSEAVARSYKSYINSYIEEENLVNRQGMVQIAEMKFSLESFVCEKVKGYDNEQKRIRNVKSAAKKMIEYLECALGK